MKTPGPDIPTLLPNQKKHNKNSIYKKLTECLFDSLLPCPSSPIWLKAASVSLRLFAVWFRSSLRPFHPSSSRSSLKLFSRSSRDSRSARRAVSWCSESEAWSSSIVLSRRSSFSLPFVISSSSCMLTLSRLSIWVWRSRTVRSTLRTERSLLLRSFSCSSSVFSSWGILRIYSRDLRNRTYLLNPAM